ncbi:ATP-binding protein [Geomobilimonas luticola]|uniref:ATP-binding protein n=1 Tax=Geomobilimonas luticola TaxID=1114878 RepID=A0ABS5SAE1_9BACT|nr:ATP-binding protein [Geomobilimonas luticola]MBT0652344.1 ATP-binding protein [Geomobilimonas luticola]
MNKPMSAQTTFATSDQAGQVIPFFPQRDTNLQVALFADNLTHLQALEQEAKLMLAVAMLRRGWNKGRDKHGQEESLTSIFPFLGEDVGLEQVEELLTKTFEENRQRENASSQAGIALNFVTFCEKWQLDRFERTVVMLLLLQNTAPDFSACFRKSGFEEHCDNGMEIGTLLTIIAPDLRQQLDCRRYFSINSTLFRERVLTQYGDIDGSSTILRMSVYLHERNVRYILGDNNLYHHAFNFIKRERSGVPLEQVVLPEKLKEDLVSSVERFMAGRQAGALAGLDQFFGYGTGLAILFHGPSGTGKTMMAKGLAHYFSAPLLTLNLEDMSEMRMNEVDILSFLFREAALMGAIVFLDECDDIFSGRGNSKLSRALLLELEKSRCITILATNRPVELDPAMERRLALKIHFPLPDVFLRKRMWQALMPDFLLYADDVDLNSLAERYFFTGGLIKNSIFMASNAAIAAGQTVITCELLEQAASQQSVSLSDTNGICQIYTPKSSLDALPLHQIQKEQLCNTTRAWQRLKTEGLGLNLLISSTDVITGIKAAEALATACGLKVRCFDYGRVVSMAEDNKMVDPVSQRKIYPMQYAFSNGTGDAAMLLFVDHEGLVDKILSGDEDVGGKGLLLSDLTGHLRKYSGLFCMVTTKLQNTSLPVEFNLHYQLEYPPEELQMRQWELYLGDKAVSDDQLVSLVESYPMHTAEIDFIARQAATQSIIKGMNGKPTIKSIREVIGRYRQKRSMPVLFGGTR